MNPFELLASQHWVERLGWVLIHFVWQGAAIALAYALARDAIGRARPNTRYLLACAALAAMVAAPFLTWALTGPAAPYGQKAFQVVSQTGPRSASQTASQTAAALLAALAGGRPVPSSAMPWVVAAWLLGVAAFSLRLAGGWAASVRLRRARPAPLEWQRRLAALAERMGVRRAARLMVSPLAHAPAVAGWLKPVVLVPVGALSGLPAEQLEAVLAHELAHVLRNDYLVNLLQSAVEALLFYHPAVWWISGQIRREREMCCDDLAAAAGGDALAYASALAEIAIGARSDAGLAMAATGGRLRARIARLLGQPEAPARPGRGAFAGVLLLALMAYGVYAQQQAAPAFQVASIKRNAESNPRGMMVHFMLGGRLTTRNAPLRLLLQNAYRMQDFQLVGGPSWVDSDGYDIEAKPEAAVSEPDSRRMLQTLLAERFHLTLHHEARELPEYALTVAKGGIHEEKTKPGDCVTLEPGALPPPGSAPPCGRMAIVGEPGGARLQGSQVPVAEVTRMLGMLMGSIVVDRSGYPGTLEVDVHFAPDQATAGLMGRMGPAGQLPPNDGSRPTIFAALQESLGLKLDSIKGPVDVVVIDHVERPTGN